VTQRLPLRHFSASSSARSSTAISVSLLVLVFCNDINLSTDYHQTAAE